MRVFMTGRRRSMGLALVFFTLLCAGAVRSQTPRHTFALGDSAFLLDGRPFAIISGEMHFARIPREYWRDRLKMARAMGLNTVATYVFWNYHEPEKGKFRFDGNADLAAFVRTAGEEGLWVLLRPSPYACAEWEFGGYPWWLQNEDRMRVRGKDPHYLDLVRRYFVELGRQVAPLQITHGGNIIMVQLENEYGSYDQDKEYLAINGQILRDSGFDVDLYTCDGPAQVPKGYLPGVLPAVNGSDDVAEVKRLVRAYHDGKGPFFIAEWYPAWFDSWGEAHNVVPAAQYTAKLDAVLEAGLSINMYMVHGGTTRDFMNGANGDAAHPYSPQISSYDYDAPIDEAGNPTPKFTAFRGVIARHVPAGDSLPPVPSRNVARSIPPIALRECGSFFDNLPLPVIGDRPMTFEELGQGYGYVLYRTILAGPQTGTLTIDHVRDFAQVFVNGKRMGILDRRLGKESVDLEIPAGSDTLDILVENLGRINYGPFLNDNHKGITERVLFAGKKLQGWSMFGFPCTDFTRWRFRREGKANGPPDGPSDGPVVRRGVMRLKDTADTYLDMRSWGKGFVIINGHNLGRYWNIGPQQTIYVPGPWLRRGNNEVLVSDVLGDTRRELKTLDHPVLGELLHATVDIRGHYHAGSRGTIVSLSANRADARIRYTLDGSDPTALSKEYTMALTVTMPCTLSARAFRRGAAGEQVARVELVPSLATGKSVVSGTAFAPRYAAGGAGALVDGVRGGKSSKDGLWQGYEGTDVDMTIDLGRKTSVSEFSVRFMQEISSWVFLPVRVEFSTSADGRDFLRAGVQEAEAATPQSENGPRDFIISVPGAQARFVRMRATSILTCPSWHPGAGKNSWLFVDEIVVR